MFTSNTANAIRTEFLVPLVRSSMTGKNFSFRKVSSCFKTSMVPLAVPRVAGATHRLTVEWEESGGNKLKDSQAEINQMMSRAALIFPTMSLDVTAGEVSGVMTGKDPQRNSKGATLTYPLAMNGLYGSTSQLCGVRSSSDDKLRAAELWGDAAMAGVVDASKGRNTLHVRLARSIFGTLASHVRLLHTSARDEELNAGNGVVHTSWVKRVGKGKFEPLQHLLEQCNVDGDSFMKQLSDSVEQKEGAIDWVKFMDEACDPFAYPALCRSYM